MSVESDADRAGVMLDELATMTHSGTDYDVIMAETDGETLDGGTATDGWIEVQILTSDVTAGGIDEGESATIGSVTYRIAKIDNIGGGMSVMYLEP